MATEPGTASGDLQELARRHLWLHFSRMGAYDAAPRSRSSSAARAATSGTSTGNRYLDGLCALFCINIGHGRADIAQAGADQARSSASSPTGPTRTRARSSSRRRSPSLAPGDLNRVFFTSRRQRGGRVGAQARPPVPQADRQPEQDQVHRARDRLPRHDARRAHGHRRPGAARAVRAVHARRLPRAEHEHLPARPRARGPSTSPRRSRERILFEGPETVAAVILEPVQNAGGCFTPPEGYFQRVREICDEYDVLLISDEVICSWGRLGDWFGAQRYDYQPDIITTAKGITGAYAPMGAMIASDRVVEPFLEGDATRSSTASRSAATRWPPPSRSRTSTRSRGGRPRERARKRGARSARCSRAARHPDRRRRARRGLLPRIELVKDRDTRRRSTTRRPSAAARLPQRRAVPPRPDLPRRRPRRPGDPVRAAADRRPRAVRGDRGRSCGRCSRRRARARRRRSEHGAIC